jgi:hypothetical protein
MNKYSGNSKNSKKKSLRKNSGKNAGNILSQLLDRKRKRKTWNLGQRRQARWYDAIDQGAMLFFLSGAATLVNS